VTLSGLTPETLYHYRVLSSDACGHGPTYSTGATFTTGPAATDLSGWTLKQYGSAQTFVIPQGTSIPSGGYLVVGRNATPAEFLAYYPSMPAGTVYLNSNANGSCTAGCFPLINGDEYFELYDPLGVKTDGPTIGMAATHSAYQRAAPGDPAGSAASWNVVAEALANPGLGAGAPSGAGVRINEMSDAPDYNQEFVELYNDAGSAPPDTVPPAPVTDLAAFPVSSTSIRLAWTATGDDGTTGTAAVYDIRMSPKPIRTEADFAAATPLSLEPPPRAAGSAEQWTVGGLASDTSYSFAMKVADDASNVSGLSNPASGTTALSGGTPPVPHLVIAQFQIAGSTDDAVEIYNPTDAAISLSGYSVQYLAANGNFGFRSNLTGTNSVPAHGWYLVAANGYAGSAARDDSIGTSNMSATAGHALLVSKTTNVAGCSDAAIVDKAGYGASATCPEGGSGHNVPAPGALTSATRKPGGAAGNGQDTDVNDADFLTPAAPAFRNRSSTPATPPSALGNVGNSLYLSAGASGTTLDWANAAGAAAYHVYRGTTAGFMGSTPPPWASPTANTTLDATPPSPILFYLVRATDGASDSAN
jgi:hypothetical protein